MTRKLTQAESFQALKLLEAKLTRLEDGTVEYVDGYSDEAVAAEIGDRVPVSAIAFRRINVFGKLRSPSKDTRFTAIEKRLATIESFLNL